MYEYTNKEFEPKIQDFGDDYHQPIELEEQLRKDRTLLGRVKRMKRRYRNYFEYINAIETYAEYVYYLIDKYGGVKEFERAYLMGDMDDYLPYKPELRMTRANKQLLKLGIRNDTNTWTEPAEVNLDDYVDTKVDVTQIIPEFKTMKEKDVEMLDVKTMPSSQDILAELSMFDSYHRATHIKKKDVRKFKKERLKMKYAKVTEEDESISNKMDEYDEMKERMEFGEDPIAENDNLIIQHKGLSLRADSVEEIVIYESLKDIGLEVKAENILSKRAFKVVRRNSKRDKKKEKVKKKFKKSMDVLDFTGRGYDSYSDLERELSQLNGIDILNGGGF